MTRQPRKLTLETLDERAVPSAGGLDSGFANDGILTLGPAQPLNPDVAVQTDGKILVVSSDSINIYLDRFYPDGSPDLTFGTNGRATDSGLGDPVRFSTETLRLVVQPNDGKIVVGATARNPSDEQYLLLDDFYLSRFTPEGNLDANFFGDGGRVRTNFATSGPERYSADYLGDIGIDPFGNIIAVGTRFAFDLDPDTQSFSSLAIARYHADGRLDTQNFGGGTGKVTPDDHTLQQSYPVRVAVKSTGQFVVGYNDYPSDYSSTRLGLAYFNQAGGQIQAVTSDFLVSFSDLAVDANDRVVATGIGPTADSPWATVVRYTGGGSLDGSFGAAGIVRLAAQSVSIGSYSSGEIEIASDGKLVVSDIGQNADFSLFTRVSRLSGVDGTFDQSFGDNGISNALISESTLMRAGLAVQPDHNILVLGPTRLARLVGDVITVIPDPAAPEDPTRRAIRADGDPGSDAITFSPGVDPGTIAVTLNGDTRTLTPPTGTSFTRLVAFGGGGADTITTTVPGLPAWFYGGAGDDTLTGGDTDDVLLGGDDADTLLGGDGRDLLVGGLGADGKKVVAGGKATYTPGLDGGAGDDILIGGKTVYDAPTPANQRALGNIMARWAGPADYATRLAGLKDTVGHRGVSLTAARCPDDGALDVPAGGDDTDWFIVQNTTKPGIVRDVVADRTTRAPGVETLTDIAPPVVKSVARGVYDPATRTLTITGSGGNDTITIEEGSAGEILVTDQTGFGVGDAPLLSATDRVVVKGLGGNDVLRIDEDKGLFLTAGGGEIEFAFDGGAGKTDRLAIYGQYSAADTIDIGVNGIDLNGDGDVDVTAPNAERIDVRGMGGDDRLNAAGSAATGAGAAVPVSLAGSDGADTLVGGPGNDTLSGGPGLDAIDGRAGRDTLAESVAEYPAGTGAFFDFDLAVPVAGDITLKDRDGVTETLLGVEAAALAGDDRANRLSATDVASIDFDVTLTGGKGDDLLYGGAGDDRLEGGDGNDAMFGYAGIDLLYGGADDDLMSGGLGKNILHGEGGVNSVYEADFAAEFTAEGGKYTLTNGLLTVSSQVTRKSVLADVLVGVSRVAVVGSDGPDVMLAAAYTRGGVDLKGGLGADTLTGTNKYDTLDGGRGADIIKGLGGNDDLLGEHPQSPDNANDTLDGGAGNDTLFGGFNDSDSITGGLGADVFSLLEDPTEFKDFNAAKGDTRV